MLQAVHLGISGQVIRVIGKASKARLVLRFMTAY